MQFRFDANQEYQIRAIEAVADLLEGQPRLSGVPGYLAFADTQGSLLPPERRGQFQLAEIFPGTVANALVLSEDELLANLISVQRTNGIEPDAALACIATLNLSEWRILSGRSEILQKRTADCLSTSTSRTELSMIPGLQQISLKFILLSCHRNNIEARNDKKKPSTL